MLSTGAAHRHRQVVAVARLVFGNAGFDEVRDVLNERCHVRLALQEADHLRIAPGEVAQARLPVGIGQGARVENKVRIAGNSVLEAERLERQRQAADGPLLHSLVDDVAQRVDAHLRGVDHQVRGVDDRIE